MTMTLLFYPFLAGHMKIWGDLYLFLGTLLLTFPAFVLVKAVGVLVMLCLVLRPFFLLQDFRTLGEELWRVVCVV